MPGPTTRSSHSSLESPTSPDRHNDINNFGERSTSSLVLVHNENDASDDEEEPLIYGGEADDAENFIENDDSDATALAAPVVFGHILAPSLKLGAMLILSSQAALKVTVPSLIVLALLSAFARQIWFLLARYVRSPDVGTIVSEAFARGPRREGTRRMLRVVSRAGSAVMRLLLAVVYLRGEYVTSILVVAKRL